VPLLAREECSIIVEYLGTLHVHPVLADHNITWIHSGSFLKWQNFRTSRHTQSVYGYVK
jgi:hypothetical protein